MKIMMLILAFIFSVALSEPLDEVTLTKQLIQLYDTKL